MLRLVGVKAGHWASNLQQALSLPRPTHAELVAARDINARLVEP